MHVLVRLSNLIEMQITRVFKIFLSNKLFNAVKTVKCCKRIFGLPQVEGSAANKISMWIIRNV